MPTILIVDDSRVARLSLRRMVLSVVPEADIVEAASADDAIAAIEGRSIDKALIDYNMPGRDGLELGEELASTRPGLSMAMVTANIQDAVAGRAEALGMAFIGKPPRESEMTAFLTAEAQGAA